MEDKFESALAEAQELMEKWGNGMEDVGLEGNVVVGNSGGDGSDISFCIDSDEEEEDNSNNNNNNKKNQKNKANATLYHPLIFDPSNDSIDPSANNTTTTPLTTYDTNTTTMTPVTGSISTNPSVDSRWNPSGTVLPQPITGVPQSSSLPVTSTAGALGDALKQQTSRFASAMANMAQRAAHQVVTVTQQQQQQQQPLQHSSYHGQLPIFPTTGTNGSMLNNSFGNTSSPTSITKEVFTTPMQNYPPELDNEQKATLIRTHVGTLLPGERVIMFVAHLAHVSDSTGFSYTASNYAGGNNNNNNTSDASAIWCCAMTYYRLILFGTTSSLPQSCPQDWNTACWPARPIQLLQIPLASIERVEKNVFSTITSSTSLMGLHIVGKENGRFLRFTTPSYADTLRAQEALQTYAFPGKRNLGYLFAFESKKDQVIKSIITDTGTGQKKVTLPPVPQRFQPVLEFTRQFQKCNQGSSPQACPWAIYQAVNAQYQLCNSYPSVLAGPATLNENQMESIRVLQQSAAFRSEQRLPVLTYAHSGGGGSIWRASQPKIGLQGNRSSADEFLLAKVAEQAALANASQQQPQRAAALSRQVLIQLTGSPSMEHFNSNWWPTYSNSSIAELKILDLRPRAAAMGNRTSGYGYENTSNYPGTTLQFCNIGNIHAIRDSYQKLSNACMSPQQSDLQFTVAAGEDSKWLSFIRLILSASWEAAYWIHVFNLPVLLHCSHGWDRTSQVACLAQLMLDPYFRTFKGFACLVEKDFMAFGHPFHTRCAHGASSLGAASNSNAVAALNTSTADFDEGQVSPIFVQFLDCVYQLVSLYPEAFEFDTRYLLDLSDHVYSCRFGNFLCDTERERETMAGIRQRTNSVWDYLDERYAKGQKAMKGGVLLMPLPTLLRNVTLWTDRHAKYGPKPTQRWLPTDIHGSAETASFTQDSNSNLENDYDRQRIPTLAEVQALLFRESQNISATGTTDLDNSLPENLDNSLPEN